MREGVPSKYRCDDLNLKLIQKLCQGLRQAFVKFHEQITAGKIIKKGVNDVYERKKFRANGKGT